MYKLRNKSQGMKEEGITLIALVVTIIVLLIIVGIVIAMLRKDGVIEKAKDAKEETVVSREIELIKLAYQTLEAERVISGEDITTERIGNELKKYDEKTRAYSIDENEIGEKNIVVKKENEDGYAEIEYIETSHKYVVSLVIEKNASTLYNIKYNLGGGKINGNPSQYSPTETVRLKNPTRSWYRFIGWTGSNGNIPQMSVIIPKGSTEDKEYTANWIEIEAICKIGETKYETIQEAIDSCSKSAGEKRETIVMLKSTEEEIDTYEGQNIILDLKGYTIKSENIEKPLCINYGNLQIIDTSAEKSGKIENLNGIGVLNSGTFTLGDNNTSIDNNTPTIFGKQIGIKNEGTLNFYDGKIQGITPIQGNVNDTPAQYGPIATDYSNGITTLQLGIVTGYEARIGWVYYTSLQGAIDSSRTKETVSLIKNIQLKRTAEVAEKKDMILDLSGYELTVVPEEDRVIENCGELKIKDSSQEQKGVIKISSAKTEQNYNQQLYISVICNKDKGNLTISGGNIIGSNVNTGSYASFSISGIYNDSVGVVEFEKGLININSVEMRSYGILNKNTGTVRIFGGKICNNGNLNDSSGAVYEIDCIYNANSGKIEVYDGELNCQNVFEKSSRIKPYGIYNGGEGNIRIIGGSIKASCQYDRSENTGIYNVGKAEISGGTIDTSNNNNYYYNTNRGIINTGNLKIIGGIINGDSGIFNSGKMEIFKGIIKGKFYGILNTGTVIVGKEDDDIGVSDPKITSENIGICIREGTLEFYKGIIQGSNEALLGGITQIRKNCKIKKEIIDEQKSIYLIENINSEYIVKIEEQKYTSLKEAIDSIEGNEEKTIEVIEDFETKEKTIFDKNVKIDLKGHIVTNNYYSIFNLKNLTITDSSENKTGEINIINTIKGIYNKEQGKITIESGKININNSEVGYGIYNESNGTIEVLDGNISSSSDSSGCYGIYNANNGNISISGGKISSLAKGNTSSYAIYNASEGMIKITNGEIYSAGGWDSCGIVTGDGKVLMSGGLINIENNSGLNGRATGIYNIKGNVEIVGGTININSLMEARGIYNGGVLSLIAGTINSISINWDKTYGIYNSGNGIATVGKKGDGIISKEIPNIKVQNIYDYNYYNERYGVYNTTGRFYYYDGVIQGITKAIYSTITEIEEGTELDYNENETIVTLTTSMHDVAQIGDKTYKTLQEAIDVAENEQTNIKILRNITYTGINKSIVIPNNKNIILDLNGYKVRSAIPEKLLQNEGVLEIIDTSEGGTGALESSTEMTIKNMDGANFVLSGGSINNIGQMPIWNTGHLKIQGGTIENSNTNYTKTYAIYNENKGEIEITEGTMKCIRNSDSYTIYNASIGNVQITGGKIGNGISGYGIYNANVGTLKVKGGIISGLYYGIYNASEGDVVIEGGIVSNNSTAFYTSGYGIYNASNGNIIIGIKGDGKISQEDPKIEGHATKNTDYYGKGIHNSKGNLYIYDGTIKGKTMAISGMITEIEDKTEISLTNAEYEVLTLEKKENNVANVNGIEYDSIQKAVKACKEIESKVTILREVEAGAATIIEKEQNITIDLNGHTIKNYNELTNKGTLKIIDTSTEQTGKILSYKGTAISNSGTMGFESGSISDSIYAIRNTGTLNITGGTIANNTYGIYNEINGISTILNGNITNNTYGIYNYSNNAVTNIKGGKIESNEYGLYNDSGTTNIASLGIGNNTYGIYNAKGSVNILEVAKIQSKTGIYNASGTVNIGEIGKMNSEGPVIIGETYGLVNSATGTVYMYDGQIKGKTGAIQGFITNTEEGYTIASKSDGDYEIDYLVLSGTITTVAQVNGIDYANLQSAINSVRGEETQTIKLTNGMITTETFTINEGQDIILDMNGKTISSDLDVTIVNKGKLTIIDTSEKNVAQISSTVGVAINNTGTLTLGKDDGTVSKDIITIEGKSYGITTSGIFNFYDGTIKGTSAVNGIINNKAIGYTVKVTTIDSKEYCYLST